MEISDTNNRTGSPANDAIRMSAKPSEISLDAPAADNNQVGVVAKSLVPYNVTNAPQADAEGHFEARLFLESSHLLSSIPSQVLNQVLAELTGRPCLVPGYGMNESECRGQGLGELSRPLHEVIGTGSQVDCADYASTRKMTLRSDFHVCASPDGALCIMEDLRRHRSIVGAIGEGDKIMSSAGG